MKVKLKKLAPTAVIPTYSKTGDAGLDLTATSKQINKMGFMEYGTSISIEIPSGYVGLVFPRSSISKINMSLCNAVGVIDSGYRGEILLRFKPSMAGLGTYEVGDRVGQLVILPYPEVEFDEVDELDNTERNDGGFGSSDNV